MPPFDKRFRGGNVTASTTYLLHGSPREYLGRQAEYISGKLAHDQVRKEGGAKSYFKI